ncbi:hypothetical protein [Alysiella crassa]|uniref:hypothetical protein n=1 Tax=Alysiella crassa TaxID=153491 RepID=UPI0012EBC5CD|nr:hypothetical protein [Alysiella crassa]UOP07870.1 hypothetical protein LVJ80_05930 [Alysiella crassa]
MPRYLNHLVRDTHPTFLVLVKMVRTERQPESLPQGSQQGKINAVEQSGLSIIFRF